MAGFSIGGIASGFDTATMIQQLMQIERQPVVRLEQRQAQLRQADDAWSKVTTKLSAFRTALDKVRHAADWSGFTSATSSNEDAVGITASATADIASQSFTVSRLASSHQVVLGTTYGTKDATLAAGTVTVADAAGNPLATFTADGTTTLADLADQIDADTTLGVDASVIKTSDAGYQLVLTSKITGDESVFTVDVGTTGLGAETATTTGEDAQIQIGGLTVTRSSNTITDLVDGATIQLKQTTTDPVTVGVSRDDDAAVAAVKGLVDAANGVLNELKTHTRYNAESGASGVLNGDALARDLANGLRQALSGAVGSGAISHASQVGISLTRDGAVTLDQAKLKTALTDDPTGVAAFFGQSVSGMAGVELAGTTSKTVAGTYDVQIDQSATIALIEGATYTPISGDPKTYAITSGETTVKVTIAAGASLAQARSAIQSALIRAGVDNLTASEDGSALSISETRAGAHSFEVALESGVDEFGIVGTPLSHATPGQNVSGSISTATATGGSGNKLTAVGGDADGLSLTYTGPAPASGTITYSSGFGGVLDAFLARAEGSDGSIQRARDAIDGRIDSFDDQIEAYEERLYLREQTMRRQFTSMETALSQLQAEGNWLAGQLGSLGVQ